MSTTESTLPTSAAAETDRLLGELEDLYVDNGERWADARPAILARMKAARADALKACEATLNETKSGVIAAKVLAAGQDAVIRAFYRFAAEHIYPTANPSVAERLSVVATGGYGRGLLAPGSDIDLLFLYPYRPTPWTESMVETILYMMWDLGLKVGHAARSVDECIKLARVDTTICTALLECRFIDGDENLADHLVERFDQAVVRGTGKKFIAAKLAERDERHRRQGMTRYLVEPNVKEGKGGLRDLNTLFWIAKYFYRVRTEAELVDEGVFSEKEYRLFKKCDDFLWSVRCHLHFLTGRAEERLTFELQREIAQRLGYAPRPGLSDVERFMKHYFLVAKDVGDLTRILCAALEAQHVVQALGLSRMLRSLTGQAVRILTPDFHAEHNRIVLTRPDAFSEDPVNMLRIFELADANNLSPHPDTMFELRRSLRLIDQSVRADPEANRIFLALLTESNDPATLLRLMNETGVLGAFVPDFGKVVAMMQFNMYHHYTVDEHLIRTIGVLADIEQGRAEHEHPLATQLVKTIQNRRALYVAVFLHDIAKGRPKDHSIEGARIARRLCPRFGLTAAETELVAWLVEEHLTMSITAQSRDLSDPKTIDAFAQKVQSFERLTLLEILTEVDIAAVGPNVWNGWKRQLLATLYDETEAIIAARHTRRPRSARIKAAHATFIKRATFLTPEERQATVDRHGKPYWIRTHIDDALYHAELMKSGDPANIISGFRKLSDSGVTEMTLIARDAPRLLAVVAAACASAQANVVSADIFTTRDGLALDIFTITPLSDDAEDEEQRVKRIAQTVRDALAERVPVPKAIDRRARAVKQKAFTHPTDVLLSNDWSDGYTAVEVTGLDRPGLFRDLAEAFLDLKLNVRSAQIATFGERVVDVFYVTGPDDVQITDPELKTKIAEHLVEAYDRPGEARLAKSAA
ncbi:[protein-PII] uridylyltransferase [Acuticoccus mangrovi]|uniref:Bifunctional uridylyltransferase/uridylyl-removing enzyme n=1 Tax=Acuticoccus mangrovi TaxID=2796142 RepID=A0A934ITA6_9HYPH|nr:[protein-PII] uridylyltransferase [Acuticoccus mangrovi]MBJ3777802.1 [protein-PII] uridylyltransferase [Acuticoccus mangrovi]